MLSVDGKQENEAGAEKSQAAIKKARGRPRKVKEDESDAVSMDSLAATTAAKKAKPVKKKKRKRADPFFPKGAPPPRDWTELGTMEEGCRAHFVSLFRGQLGGVAWRAEYFFYFTVHQGKLYFLCTYILCY